MTDAQLTAILGKYPASDVKEFINKYVHKIYLDPSSTVNISCDFDYNKKEPISQVHYCTDYADGIITLVPAYDTMVARMYYNKHISIEAIREFECYATVQNEYMKQAIAEAKARKLEGKTLEPRKPRDYQALANSKNYPPASE